MARPKLRAAAREAATITWVKKGKAVARQADKKMLTVHLPAEVHQLLWDRRAKTGIPLNRSIADAVVRVFGKTKMLKFKRF